MRDDLAKVICEKERSGDRSYMGGRKGYDGEHRSRNRGDRDEDYADLDSLPKHESMTKRLGYNQRRFSENLGALRGLVVKNVGKNWDKLYSAICAQVSPTGSNIERHVHQHLPDYIDVQTRLNADGRVEVYDSSFYHGGWVVIDQAMTRAGYYVHPVTRCITRYRRKRRLRDLWRQKAKAPSWYDVDDLTQLHLLSKRWWLVTLAPIPAACYHLDERGHTYCDLPSEDTISSRRRYYDMRELSGVYRREGVYGLRKATPPRKLLEQFGLAKE